MQEFRIFRALGLSFKAWFKNFVPFTLLAVVLYSPVVIWILKFDIASLDSESSVEHLLDWWIYLVLGLSTLLAPLLTYRVVQDLNGTRVSLLTSIKFGLRGIAPAVILAVIAAVLGVAHAGIVGTILQCMWFVASPAAVAEQLGPFTAFSRSSQLTHKRRWGIFVMNLLLVLGVAGLLFLWIKPMFESVGDDLDAAAHAFRTAGAMIVLVLGLYQLLLGIVQAVSYALLRQDKDGVSHAELARIFE